MNVRVKNAKPNPVKKIIKRCLQHLAASFGRHVRASKEPQLLVLMYHRILPRHDPRAQLEEPGMMVTPDTFRLHINTLKQYFTLIKLSDWVQRKSDGTQLPANACAITFDDGWADNYEYAFPVLKDLEAPATIFLVADMIGTEQRFWPERLAHIMTTVALRYPQYWTHPELAWLQENPELYRFSETPPTSEELSALIAWLKDYSDQEMHDRLNRIDGVLQLVIDHHLPSLLDWQQITEMLDSGLIDIGSHTCRHVRLNENTSAAQIRDEIVNSKQVIEKHTNKTIDTFCYPNGDHCPEAIELVKQTYAAAVTTQSGWNSQHTNIHMLQRIGIHQDITADKTAFLARISGWM